MALLLNDDKLCDFELQLQLYNNDLNCIFKDKIEVTHYSGKDGSFNLTHVGRGEDMKVQESWARFHPIIEEGRDCVIAYLGN